MITYGQRLNLDAIGYLQTHNHENNFLKIDFLLQNYFSFILVWYSGSCFSFHNY